jgi:transcriptional regulator with XRE-family HTH domain
MTIIDTFANRLKKAMNYTNMKQVDLVNKTGLDKTLINKYLAGIMKAKQDKLTILADALNVNEVWLMGYDVPMEKNLNTYKIDKFGNSVIPIPILRYS